MQVRLCNVLIYRFVCDPNAEIPTLQKWKFFSSSNNVSAKDDLDAIVRTFYVRFERLVGIVSLWKDSFVIWRGRGWFYCLISTRFYGICSHGFCLCKGMCVCVCVCRTRNRQEKRCKSFNCLLKLKVTN